MDTEDLKGAPTTLGRWRAALLGALFRVTTSGRFIPEIDTLRFIAIVAVVLFHAVGHYFIIPAAKPQPFWQGDWNLLRFFIWYGWFGVQLFFIISGFILAMPFADHHLNGAPKVRLKKYFLRRLTRLQPPYVISLLLILWLLVALNVHSLRTLLPHLFAHMGYVHNPIYGAVSSPGYVAVNHVTWSLEIEVQFYILAPLLCSVFAIRSVALRRIVMVAAIVLGGLASSRFPQAFMDLSILGQLRYFLLGFLLADFHLTEWQGRPVRTWAWDLYALPAWLAIPYVLQSPAATWYAMPWVLLVAYVGAFRGRLLGLFFTNAWIAALGGMCYTVYLYHVHMIYWVKVWLAEHLLGPVPVGSPMALVHMGLMVMVVLAFSAVLFVLFEKPFMSSRWPAAFRAGLRRLLVRCHLLPASDPLDPRLES